MKMNVQLSSLTRFKAEGITILSIQRSRTSKNPTDFFQNQVDRLEDELVAEQEKFKAINEELEQTFAEMSGY